MCSETEVTCNSKEAKDGFRISKAVRAALEAVRLGHGGVEYVAEVLGCSTKTIERGTVELVQLPDDPAAGRVRRPGGGRKKKLNPIRLLSGI